MRVAEHEESDKEGWAGDGAWRKLPDSVGELSWGGPSRPCVLVCVIQRAAESHWRLGFQELIVEGMRMS